MEALKVLYRLSDAGYTAYLVGGSVRDLLLGRKPKDFDVGTDAHPNEIRAIFKNCFLIGRRFRLAHIIYGKKVIETSTFRRPPSAQDMENGLQVEDNTFGTPAEDATRRDFTVNGLFYDIRTFAVIDYVGGLEDLEKRVLRCIGDPNVRFREDPVRMMRAVKFAARLSFTIDPPSREAILTYHSDILNASVPRVCEEVFRLFTHNSSAAAFRLMWEFKLLDDLLPQLSSFISASGGADAPVWKYLSALDADPVSESATNGLRTACLYYAMVAAHLAEAARNAPDASVNRQSVTQETLAEIAQHLRIPKAAFYSALSMMDVQRRFDDAPRKDARAHRFIRNELFEEALALRRIVLAAEGRDAALVALWQAYHDEEKRAWEGSEEGWLIHNMRDPERRRAPRRRGGRGRGRGGARNAPPSENAHGATPSEGAQRGDSQSEGAHSGQHRRRRGRRGGRGRNRNASRPSAPPPSDSPH